MRPAPLSLPAALAVAALAAAVAPRAETALEPIFRSAYGSTLYRLEATFPLSGSDSIPENTKGLGQSELEYPLDAFLVGARFRQDFRNAEGRGLGLSLAAWTNAGQPRSRMLDSDWMGARASSGITTSSLLYKFSYTRSRARLRWFGGEAGADIGDYALFGKPVRYGLAIRAERVEYALYGAEGWQNFPGEDAKVSAIPDSIRVLRYGLTRVQPRLFAEMRLMGSARAELKLSLSAAPALAWDHDDHLLRKKESDTFAYGFEIGGGTELAIRLAARLRLIVAGDLAYFRAKGEMDQHFYGDDPGTGKDETGLDIENVVTRIIGLGGGLSLGARYVF
jgi:hypothetical protein